MADVAREVIVLAESDKIGRKMPNLEIAWQQVHTLVTDSGITTQQQQTIEQQGVAVVIAELNDGH